MSEIFFDTVDDATELIKALTAEGYATDLRREPFAGEDDAEDHAWALLVTPFDERVVEMVDVYGGWLPGDERLPGTEATPGITADAADLPTQPRRLKHSDSQDSI